MKRDGYWNMVNPTIDRKDNDGDYTYKNCRFIEKVDHDKKSYTERIINKKGEFVKCY